jgi:hypothetical protein
MKRLIVTVADKTKIHNLKAICNIIYLSKYSNCIGIEIHESNIPLLMKDDNVIRFRESEEGIFQPSCICV